MTRLANDPRSAVTGPLRQRIDELFRIIDGAEFDRLACVFAPDGRYERPGYPPLEGLAAIEHFYRDVRIIEAGRHTITGFVETRDTAVALGRFTGRLRDGAPAAIEFADAYRFAPTGIIERKTYFFTPAL